jgi:CIC family chloride channel protein
MFESDKYNTTLIRDLMFMPEYTISLHESMEEVVRKFHVSKRYNIAVLDHDKYIGFLSRARVFSSYRETLKKISRE